MATVFVTGGSGFVGQRLIAALRAQGYTVRALARSERAARLVEAAGATSVAGDLEDLEALSAGMQGCQTVFHAAAILDFARDAASQYRANVEGTRNVLTAAQVARVPSFVLISAASIVSDGSPVVGADESWPIPAQPVGVYSRTKAEAERLVLEANGPAFRTVAVRPPLIWGAANSVGLPELVESVRKGQFRWFSQGRYPYNTCYVENVCEGAILAAERGQGGEAYFLTDGDQTTFRDFATALLETQGVTPGQASLPLWLVKMFAHSLETFWKITRRPGAPPLTVEGVALLGPFAVVDTKARRELGYVGKISRAEGFERMRGASTISH